MDGVEHMKYRSVTEGFADSKWCYAFNNFLWIQALKCKNFRGVLWRVRGLKLDLPLTKLAWCSWSVQFSFLLQSGCDVLNVAGMLCCLIWQQAQKAQPPPGCRGTSEIFLLYLPLCLPESIDWALIPGGYPSPWSPVSGILMGSSRVGFPIILLHLLKLPWLWEL